MTTLNLTQPTPYAPTGLVIVPGVQSASLSWDPSPNLSDKFEVWGSTTTNESSAATLYQTVSTNTAALLDLAPGVTYYFWVRTLNEFGAVSDFTSTPGATAVGSYLNTLYIGLQAIAAPGGAALTYQNLKANVYYTPSGGSPTSTGFTSFSTTTTQTSLGAKAWTNVGNLRVDDGNSATVTLSASEITEIALFPLADLGIPSTATITGIELQLKGETTAYNDTITIVSLCDATGEPDNDSAYNAVDSFTANNTQQTKTAGSSTELFGLYWGDGYIVVPGTLAPSASVSAGTVSTGISGASTSSVSGYGTYFEGATVSFDMPSTGGGETVSVSISCAYEASSISVSAGQKLAIDTRLRVTDVTDSITVPGTVYNRVYLNNAGTTYGQTSGLVNFTQTFSSKFTGALIPGHSYEVAVGVAKVQVTGSPTCTLGVTEGSATAASYIIN